MMTQAMARSRLSGVIQAATTAALVAAFALTFDFSAAKAAEAECKAMAEALLANAKIPYHSYTTMAFEYSAPIGEARRKLAMPSSQESEAIFTGTHLFLKLPTGKWVDSRISTEALQEQVRAAASKFADCQRLADETISGELNAVYTAQSSDEKHTMTTKIWIAVDRGLPVRSETDIGVMEAPGQAVMHQHVSTRSTYGDVQAPDVN